jgi:putative ABC transport system ATP-binding protein
MKSVFFGENIVKSFGDGDKSRKVLDGVSLAVSEGEFVSIMGPSGSGKSTLMFALSGMDGVDSGRVHFEGRDISGMTENELADMRRTRMGFVFQQPTLLKNLNILDNIILPSMRDNRGHNGKIVARARMLMERTGIAGLEERGVTEVSGGQLQRVGICRALMSRPAVLFADEPTGSLNSQSAQEIMDIFAEISDEGTAVVLVTHDARVAAQTQRIMFMRDGKIVREMQFAEAASEGLEDRFQEVVATMREHCI